MTKDPDHHPLKAAEAFIARLRTWWQQRNELQNMDRREVDRIAIDLGMTAHELEHLAARGPGAAELLHRRLAALGLTRNDVERLGFELMRDLERTCSCCDQKRVCERDLTNLPNGPEWKEYCPNAISLEAVAGTKGRFPA